MGTPRSTIPKIIEKNINFHHPAFNPKKGTSFPDIEQLLTEIAVNLEMFDSSRPAEGNFTKNDLESAREELLSTIAKWFHDLYEYARGTPWLKAFVNQLQQENASIVSFNWDLILDQLLFPNGISSESYGLRVTSSPAPLLLKPHGSLNWYEGTQISKVSNQKRITIFNHKSDNERIAAFLYPREIRSKSGKQYSPLIIPPTYLKDFTRPVFKRLWKKCTAILSTPQKLVFLGYSLPPADLHSQFIFRCGFHNQLEGQLKKDGKRHVPTGVAEVVIVNPDQEAARRIEALAGPKISCTWIPKRIQDWLQNY